jgi:hypothetical protein
MQLQVNRLGLLVVGAAVVLCGVLFFCLVGGYGYVQLRPLPTPTLSFIDSVRATATGQALEAAQDPTPTITPTSTVPPTEPAAPDPTLEPTTSPTQQPTLASEATATTPAAATAGPISPPPPTSTPPPQPAQTCGPSRTTSLIRGPYLQWVRPNAITVVWETVDEVTSMVDFGATAAYGSTATDCDSTSRHEVTLTGLNPSTVYHYRVRSGSQTLSDDRTFKTAAGPGQTSLTFAVLSETQSGIPRGHFDRYRDSADQDHPKSAAKIQAINPDFYLHVGGLVFDGSDLAAWDDFFHFEGNLMSRVTMFPALGESEGAHYNYFRIFHLPNNERWYSFDYGNAHFVCLQIDGQGDASPGSEQYQWLERDLANSDKLWKFVFFSYPPYSYGPVGSKPEARHVHSLFVNYGVEMVFSGNDRNYQRFLVDGVTYIVTGGGAAYTGKLTGGSEVAPVFMERTKHVMKITINGNTLHSVAYRLDAAGSEMDPFTLAPR